jgi:hypothetical protein
VEKDGRFGELRKETEMATRKKATGGKGEVKKQKSRKATIKDLDVKSKGKDIKGGFCGTGTHYPEPIIIVR